MIIFRNHTHVTCQSNQSKDQTDKMRRASSILSNYHRNFFFPYFFEKNSSGFQKNCLQNPKWTTNFQIVQILMKNHFNLSSMKSMKKLLISPASVIFPAISKFELSHELKCKTKHNTRLKLKLIFINNFLS